MLESLTLSELEYEPEAPSLGLGCRQLCGHKLEGDLQSMHQRRVPRAGLGIVQELGMGADVLQECRDRVVALVGGVPEITATCLSAAPPCATLLPILWI